MSDLPKEEKHSNSDHEIRKLELSQAFELKKEELRVGVRKVIYGSMIVGIAAAAFPFLSQFAESLFARDIAQIKREENFALLAEKNRLEEKTVQLEWDLQQSRDNRDFLQSLAKEGRSQDMETRIRLAEFYAFLAEEGERAAWDAFKAHLYEIRERQNEEERRLEETLSGTDDAERARVVAEVQLQQIQRQRDPLPTLLSQGQGDDLQALIAKLESANSQIRRQARSDIAALGLPIVPEMMAILVTPDISYRLRLGALVSLTEMMRNNKAKRNIIASQLTDSDLDILARAAGDDDRTVRIYASEFLFDLGDPRVIPIIQRIFPIMSVDGRYNLALVVKGAAPDVSSSDVPAVTTAIRSLKSASAPKTNNLLDEAIDLLPK